MKIAAILTVYNDEAFLPQFLDYYSAQVDTIFAIDNESDDRSIEILKRYPKVELSVYQTGGRFNHERKNEVLNEKAKSCVGSFDYTLVLDVDEFIVPKKLGPIRTALEANPSRPAFGTSGYNMFTYPWDEPYDPKKPLIEQRCWGVPNDHYSKPVISRPDADLKFALGRHFIEGVPKPQIDSREEALFFLLHYRGFDEELYLKRCIMKRDRNELSFARSYYAHGSEQDFMKRLEYEKGAHPPVKVL